jgi:hypothetical protein
MLTRVARPFGAPSIGFPGELSSVKWTDARKVAESRTPFLTRFPARQAIGRPKRWHGQKNRAHGGRAHELAWIPPTERGRCRMVLLRGALWAVNVEGTPGMQEQELRDLYTQFRDQNIQALMRKGLPRLRISAPVDIFTARP